MFKVSKFGGSSLSDATQFKKVKEIVLSDPDRKVVVVSALGKRFSDDSKITDLLYILHAHLKYSVSYDEIWKTIRNRFIGVRDELHIEYDIESDLMSLELELNKNTNEDFLISRGEYLTAILMSHFLGYKFVDAKDLIIFDYNGKVNDNLTEINIKKYQQKYENIVVPGFYGVYQDGSIKLFSRGGSDITGSILSKSLNVDIYENWTDVSGIMMADPRVIKNPLSIKEITYNELRELSYMGANVLHEETIFPVQELNIPINIRNTNEPNHEGTIIRSICKENTQLVTGIAGKKNFVSFTVVKSHMSNEVGFVRKVLSIFERYNVSIEHIPTGIDSVSVVVSEENVKKRIYDIVTDIKTSLNATVEIEHNIALVAIVGRNMAQKRGLSGKLFSILGNNDINVKMIAQGPQELNIIVGVDNEQYNETIQVIYKELVSK